MKIIIGNYNRQGYEILGLDGDGQIEQELYSAGNNRHESDSAQSLPSESHNALDLKTIRDYCKQTGREIAEEHGLPFGGAELTA